MLFVTQAFVPWAMQHTCPDRQIQMTAAVAVAWDWQTEEGALVEATTVCSAHVSSQRRELLCSNLVAPREARPPAGAVGLYGITTPNNGSFPPYSSKHKPHACCLGILLPGGTQPLPKPPKRYVQGTIRHMAVQGPAVEKAVDCLRILTTGNDANKVSLFSIPAAMPALVRLMQAADQVESSLPALLTLDPKTQRHGSLRSWALGMLQRSCSTCDAETGVNLVLLWQQHGAAVGSDAYLCASSSMVSFVSVMSRLGGHHYHRPMPAASRLQHAE